MNNKITEKEKILFTNMLPHQIDGAFQAACQDGNLEKIIYLLTSSELKMNANIHFNDDNGLKSAAATNKLEIMKYLLTSPDLNEHANIRAEKEYCFRKAARYGYLEMVKYLLTSPDLYYRANIDVNKNNALSGACDENHTEVIRYLLSSPDLSIHTDINADNGDIIRFLTKMERLETLKTVVKYSKEPIDLHVNKDEVFKHILSHKNLEFAQYIIFELNIKKTDNIKSLLLNANRKDIENMFDLRDLNQKLNDNLDISSNGANKKKI